MKKFKFKSRLLYSCLAMFVFSTVLMVSCDTEEIQSGEESIETNLRKGKPAKIDVCHYSADDDQWILLNVKESAWADHVLHGDVRLDDQDGDGFVPDNECGIGPMGDCDDNDPTISPGEVEICDDGIDNNCDGQVDEDCLCDANCSYADLDLYGPYLSISYFEDYQGSGLPAVLLYRVDDGLEDIFLPAVQIVYNLNFPGEYEFVVFNEIFYDCFDIGLPCDDPNTCPYGFTLSEEDALCLIEQALSLGLPENRSNIELKLIKDKK